jgi:hypothetical protein
MAVDNRNEVTTQLKVTASRLKSLSIDGKAMFTDEMRKVAKNELVATIARIEICFFVQITVILFFTSNYFSNLYINNSIE